MEKVFEFLFKYRPLVFQRGDIVFSVSPALAFAVGAGIAVLIAVLYSRVRGKSTPRDRTLMGLLRIGTVMVLLFALTRPVLMLSTSVPQKNFIGILVDDSRSMQIADIDDRARGELVQAAFGEDSDVMRELSDRFLLRFFSFSGSTERIAAPDGLRYEGTRTALGGALNRARQELSGVPLAGLIVVTDGADNSGEQLSDALVPLQAANVPVFAVAVGREEFDRDIALRRVETPRSVLKGASLVVDLTIAQRGYRSREVTLYVEDSNHIVTEQQVQLPADGEAARVRVHLTAEEVGPRLFRFRIAPLDGEMVTQNNEQEALIIVEDRSESILYFEGEPRFEVGFMRRAIAGDENLRVALLQRTADDKFLRLDVDGPDELAAGFPTTREELFAYRGLVLGSVEASFFTHDQLQMISEFVSQRGGGLLFLGGARAFAEGGYAGTPLEDVMPLVLEEPNGEVVSRLLDVELTPAGMTHAVTQLGGTEEESAERWAALPHVTSVNPLSRIKPGAVALVTGDVEGSSDQQVVLAHQRYGRGKVLALTIQDSWMWQMHADIPLEDQTYETLWRQLLRWLVSYVPDRIALNTDRDRAAPGEGVDLIASVEDDRYLGVNNTSVVARVIDPTGAVSEIPLEWAVERDGEYRAGFVPSERGVYEIQVDASAAGAAAGSDTTFLQVGDLETEFYDAEMRSAALRRVAQETGGRYYTIDDIATLPEDITFSESGSTVIEERDLWNMPIVFLIAMLFMGTEWGYRRARGLA